MGREYTDGKALIAQQPKKHGTWEGPIGLMLRERGTIRNEGGDKNNDKHSEARMEMMGRRKPFLSRTHRPRVAGRHSHSVTNLQGTDDRQSLLSETCFGKSSFAIPQAVCFLQGIKKLGEKNHPDNLKHVVGCLEWFVIVERDESLGMDDETEEEEEEVSSAEAWECKSLSPRHNKCLVTARKE
ncbi:hypothetical protein NPIL_206471 [Nephila pilipes]|uniref:Uncharacterized protein n=1 Tax=Nephila pilipes TaxID=299642 RepID=A0A8X6QAZ7_NEPPI|nr:hypothetical protein NPIL_206471 [Nephila pilipes]